MKNFSILQWILVVLCFPLSLIVLAFFILNEKVKKEGV